jgi:hypothetical protein
MKFTEILKMIKTICHYPVVLYLGYCLGSNKLEKVELICNKRLKKNEKDIVALFALMHSFSYRKEYEKAKNVFYLMLQINPSLNKETKRRFIKYVIQAELKEKKYDIVKADCIELLKNENDFELRKMLKGILCKAFYCTWDFYKVRELCSELIIEYPNDLDTIDFTNEYLEAIEKERKNFEARMRQKQSEKS